MADIVDGGGPDSVFQDTLDGGTPATVYPPALTPFPQGRPVPSVQIIVSDVKPGTAAVDVYRIADGRTTLVRGGIRKSAIGGTTLVDWEAPFGVPIQYRAEQFDDTDTSLGFTETATTTLDVTSAWLHQPLNPSQAASPIMLWGTALERQRKTPGEMVWVQGAEFATWVGGQRRGLEDVKLALLTDPAVADAMQVMLGAYGARSSAVLCIRTPPPMRLPRTLYAVVSDVTETTLNRPGAGEAIRFDFTATESRPPAPGLVTAVLRRMDIDAAYPTRAARAAAYATRLDRDSDYSLAGVADA